MADVVELCNRVILIQAGRLIYDGDLPSLSEQLAPFKLVRMTANLDDPVTALAPIISSEIDLLSTQNGEIVLRVARRQSASVVADLLRRLPIIDLSIENPPIEAVIDQIYQGEVL